MLIDAKYYDGTNPDLQKVTLELWSDRLYILTPDGNISWYYNKIIVQEKLSRQSDSRLSNSDTPDAQINISNPDDFAKILEKLPNQKNVKKFHPAFYISVSLLLLLFLVFYLIPAASPTIAVHTPKNWEEKLGAYAANSITTNAKICNQTQGLNALKKLTSTLAKQTNYRFSFKPVVVESIELNAFALPAGNIIIYSKMLESAAGQDEIIGVIAHQMGHIAKHHSLEATTRTYLLNMFISREYIAHQLSKLKYSRTKEAQADEFALEVLQKANVNPQGLYNFFSKLKKQESGLFKLVFLSSHSASSARMGAISRKLNKPKEYSSILTEQEWQELKVICK